jgi:hypothetical protein
VSAYRDIGVSAVTDSTVHTRYIAGRPEANHRVYGKPSQTGQSDIRTLGAANRSRYSAQSHASSTGRARRVITERVRRLGV